MRQAKTVQAQTSFFTMRPLAGACQACIAVLALNASACAFADQKHSPRDVLIAQANTQLAAASSSASQSEPAQARFPITAFEVSGNNPIGDVAAQRILAAFVRADASIESLQQATAALDAAMARQGFGLHRTNLPPQEINGKVRLDIVEYKIGKVTVEGNQNYSEANVRRALPELQSGQVPSLQELALQTALANESISRKLAVSLKASDQSDAIDAVIRVRDGKPWNASASLSNSGSAATGRDRFTLSASHANLMDRDHSADLTYTTSLAEPSRVRQFGLNYKIPVYSWGGSWSLTASSATVKGEFGSFTSNGAGKSWGLGYTQHLGGSGNIRHFVSARVDEKLSMAASVSGVVIGVDRRSRPLTLGYLARSNSTDMIWDFGANYAVNLRSGAGNDDATYNLEDPTRNPSSGWKTLRLNGSVFMPIAKDWQLLWRSQAQLTRQPLIAAEQIATGGLSWVRGSNGLTADKGFMSSLDITTPELFKGFRVLVFLDAGQLNNHAPTPSKPNSDTLASAGLGVRYYGGNGFYLTADQGHVLKGSNIASTINSSAPRKGDDRFFVTLGLRY